MTVLCTRPSHSCKVLIGFDNLLIPLRELLVLSDQWRRRKCKPCNLPTLSLTVLSHYCAATPATHFFQLKWSGRNNEGAALAKITVRQLFWFLMWPTFPKMGWNSSSHEESLLRKIICCLRSPWNLDLVIVVVIVELCRECQTNVPIGMAHTPQ